MLDARLVPFTSILVLLACGAGCDGGGRARTAADGDAGSDAGQSSEEEDAGSDAGEPGPGLDLFEAWAEARTALRASPDHLPARAEALIAQKDPEAIFSFVRDEIATYPPAAAGFASVLNATRWGVRGALRGGAGTPREKAEMLVWMYEQAGFGASVVRCAPDAARVDAKKMLFRPIERRFEPAASPAQAQAWRAALGDAEIERSVIDRDGGEARALAAELLAQLPDSLEAPFDFTLGDVPLVRVTIDGEPKYANPLVADAAFGESLCVGEPSSVSGAYPAQRVRVKLEGARADAPFARFTLVEREYTADEVVGRRIHLGFRPPRKTAELVRTRMADVDALLPILTVAAPGLAGEERDQLAAMGKAVSLGGDVYELDGDDVLVNGERLAQPSSDPTDIARVDSVTASVDPAAFPRVRLRVSALDADGNGVRQLPAGAFTLEEEGERVSFSVARNAAPAPRVALVFDQSTSIPDEFRAAGAVAVAEDILDALYGASAEASVRIGVVSVGTTASWLGPWVSGLATAKAQVQELDGAPSGSQVWSALKHAAAERPTLVILVTDGDATDEATPEIRGALAAGAPVLTLGVGTPVQSTLDAISGLSGGSSASVTTQGEAVSAALTALEASRREDYVLTYRAPREGPATRAVSLRLNGKSVALTYEVPATPAPPPALAGLYLTLRVGDREATRALAGFSSGFTTANVPVTEEMLEDVRSLLFGRVSIAVEAAAPSPSVVLDDWLAEKQSIEPLWRALEARDEAAVLAAIEQGFTLTPPKLPLAQPPLLDAASDDALTFETGLRVATLVQKARDGGPLSRQLDIFPLSRWATAAEDPRSAFERTLAATASLAVMEAGMFAGTSTREALAGQTLSALAAGQARNQAGLSDAQRLAWAALEEPFGADHTLLVPHAPGPFWAVDERTGSVIGVLADGSGGAVEDACSTYDLANSFLHLFGLLGSFFEAGAFGPWIALAQWEVKYVTIATIVIAGGTPGGDTDLTNPAEDMACAMLDDALGDAIPGLGTYESIVDTADIVGIDTGLPTVCGGGEGPC